MKKYISTSFQFILVFVLISNFSNAQLQTTWVKTLFYDPGSLAPIRFDSLNVGPSGIAVRPDGNYYVLNMDYQNTNNSIYYMDSLSNIISTFVVHPWGSTQYRDAYSLMPTPDSGCVYIDYNFNWHEPTPQTLCYRLKKIKGSAEVILYTWCNNMFDYPPNVRQVFPNYHNSYYVKLDSIYVDILTNDTLQERNINFVFQNDDILYSDSQFVRRNLSGIVNWSISTDGYQAIAVDENIFYAKKDSLRKYNAVTGNLIWTRPFSLSGNFCIHSPSEGLVVLNGRQLTILDSSGTTVGQNLISLPYRISNVITSLKDGSILTGGSFVTSTYYFPDRSFSSFLIKLNSEGRGIVDSTDFFMNGDADNDSIRSFDDDAVVIAAAFGKANSYNDVNDYLHYYPMYTTYSPDWSDSFECGLNYKYSDVNLDGIIDTNDLNEIRYPYMIPGLYIPLHVDSNPEIVSIIPDNLSPMPGDTVNFYVTMGSVSNPIDSIYGISFSFFYNGPTSYSSSEIKVYNSDLGNPSINLYSHLYQFMRLITVVLCRQDHQNVTLNGDTVLKIKTVIDPVSTPGLYPMYSRGHMITKGGFSIPFNISGDSLNIVMSTSEKRIESSIKILPNPASKEIKILSEENTIRKIVVKNLTGKIIETFYINSQAETINIENLKSGYYILECNTDKGKFNSKIVVTH
jgi:hypothetical protein